MLLLEDLKNFSEKGVRDHLLREYKATKDVLDNLTILIGYESVGSWGCDSTSFFLFKDKRDGKLYEVHGSHCSCYGFENQFDLEETNLTALRFRLDNSEHGLVFSTGGYDSNAISNIDSVRDYILSME